MRIFLFWRLFSSNHVKPQHKRYIFLALSVMCLECLDIIVYINNANSLTELYLPSQLEHFIGLVILLFILWISNLLGKVIYNKIFRKFPQFLLSRNGSLIAALTVATSLSLFAWVVLSLCQSHFYQALFLVLICRIIYQISLNVVIHNTYESILAMPDLANEFITLIVNSLELSLLLGIIGYKLIDILKFSELDSLMAFVLAIAATWVILGISSYLSSPIMLKLATTRKTQLIHSNFSNILQHNSKDTIISIILVGIKSSLSIVGVIYMPTYLMHNLNLNAHMASYIMGASSLLALILNIWVNQHLHKFNYASMVKYGLSGVIIGSIISYLLLIFQIAPFIAVAIIIIFHSLFTLACPIILGNLFPPKVRAISIISCYRNAFFIFSSSTFALIILFTQVLHHYILPSVVFLLIIMAVCYLCMLLVNNRQTEFQQSQM